MEVDVEETNLFPGSRQPARERRKADGCTALSRVRESHWLYWVKPSPLPGRKCRQGTKLPWLVQGIFRNLKLLWLSAPRWDASVTHIRSARDGGEF